MALQEGIFIKRLLVFVGFASLLISCSSGPYSVGGAVTGLSGTVVLQNNGTDDLTVTADGEFNFGTKLSNGTTYSVTVLTQPSGGTCTTSSNSGTIAGANVTNVVITCTDNFTVGGEVSGLGANESVTLQNNSGDDLQVDAAGNFTFSTVLESGDAYDVTVLTNPTRQTCTVTSGGSGMISNSSVTDVGITCVTTANRKAFVTSAAARVQTDFSGVSGADSFCMADANYASAVGGIGTYKAMIVDGTARRACSTANCSGGASENIDWIFQPSTAYYRSDGTTSILTTDTSGIFVFGTLTNSFGGSLLWTGLNGNWTTSSNICTSWTDPSVGSGNVGVGTNTNSTSIAGGFTACTDPSVQLICVEQ